MFYRFVQRTLNSSLFPYHLRTSGQVQSDLCSGSRMPLGRAEEVSISSLCYRFLTGMTVHSLPRLIRLCRGNREACFANRPALITRTGYLPVPLSLNCNRLALVRSVTRWLTSWLTGCLLQVTTSRFKRLKAVLTGELSALQNAFVTRDDYHRTFAVFTLEPSLKQGVLLQYQTLIFPL